MDPKTSETGTEARLAVLASQMVEMAKTMQRVEKKVDEVVTLDRAFAELQSDQRHHSNETKTQWAKIEANASSLLITDQKIERLGNMIRGGSMITLIFAGIMQVIIFAAIAWGFNNLSAERSRGDIQDYRLSRIELRVANLPTPIILENK